ncbi:hypothetical protein EVJ58_g325, partial [Rhodofomes roseus]
MSRFTSALTAFAVVAMAGPSVWAMPVVAPAAPTSSILVAARSGGVLAAAPTSSILAARQIDVPDLGLPGESAVDSVLGAVETAVSSITGLKRRQLPDLGLPGESLVNGALGAVETEVAGVTGLLKRHGGKDKK